MSAIGAPCDVNRAEVPGRDAPRRPGAVLAATILGSSLAFIDGSVVNVALAALAQDLGAGPAALTWAINAYLLPLAALVLLGGALGDRYGRRTTFLLGIAIFIAASIACAIAPSSAWLLAGRGAQGVGAALLTPNSLALLGSAFAGPARGRAVGIWSGAAALAGALGPLAGGWIVDTIGWRFIFLVNVPLGLAAAALAYAFVEDRFDAGSPCPVDWTGAGAATLGIGLVTFALTTLGSGNDGALSASSAAGLVGAGLIALFLKIESRQGDRALVPASLFATRGFVGLTLLTFFLYAGLGGFVVLLPFVLISGAGYSAAAAGAALLPLPLVIGFGSSLAGRWTATHGVRGALMLGSGFVAVGLALCARLSVGVIDYWSDVAPPVMFVAVGLAIVIAPLTAAVMAAVDDRHVGAASGVNSAVARLGGLVATAMLGFVFAEAAAGADVFPAVRGAALLGAASANSAVATAYLLVRAGPNAER